MVDSGEIRAGLNGAMRDALRKEKVPFIEVTTQVVAGDVIVVTIVTAAESREKASRIFTDVTKRFKTVELRSEFKTPEELAKEKAATLRLILQILTGSEPYTLESIAERAHEPSWVIKACLRALAAKGILQHVEEYEDNPTWAISPKYATYEVAVAATQAQGFDVG